ncbi:MAG: hypothetical protein HQ562_07880 [Candidatus Marinimicrobia bacterium]|nr:hypothetical protein [Candidatus Neomarinimicrobiota bacterium]
MNTRYILLADSAHLSVDGKLSVIGIFENINARKFPCTHPEISLVVQFEATRKEFGNHTLEVQLTDDRDRLVTKHGPIQFAIGNKTLKNSFARSGIIIRIINITMKKPGEYRFALFVDNRYIESVRFEAVQLQVIRPEAKA